MECAYEKLSGWKRAGQRNLSEERGWDVHMKRGEEVSVRVEKRLDKGLWE